MRKNLLLLMILLSNISFALPSNQEVISINSSDVQVTPKSKAINEIRAKIKDKYHLDIKVNAEQRYLEKNELDALELGLTNMVIISSNNMVEKYGLRDFDVFELPFIFNGLNEFNKFNNSLVSEEILRQVNKKNKNLYGLTFWAKNYKHVESNFEVVDYQSIKNKPFMVSQTEINTVVSLAMNPNGSNKVGFEELKDNNDKKNIIYANMLSLPDYEKYKFSDYNKNVYLTYHGIDIDIVLVNKRWFNKLPTDVQMGIIDIIKEVGLTQQNMMLIENQNLINNFKSKNINVKTITPSDRSLFKKEMGTAHRYYYNNINKDLLVKIYNLFK